MSSITKNIPIQNTLQSFFSISVHFSKAQSQKTLVVFASRSRYFFNQHQDSSPNILDLVTALTPCQFQACTQSQVAIRTFPVWVRIHRNFALHRGGEIYVIWQTLITSVFGSAVCPLVISSKRLMHSQVPKMCAVCQTSSASTFYM